MNYTIDPQTGYGTFAKVGGDTPTVVRRFRRVAADRSMFAVGVLEPELEDGESIERTVAGDIFIIQGQRDLRHSSARFVCRACAHRFDDYEYPEMGNGVCPMCGSADTEVA